MKMPKERIITSVIVIAISLLSGVNLSLAQVDGNSNTVRSLSLNEALQLAGQQNYQVKMAESDIDIARGQYRQTSAAFLPQISLEARGVSTNDPLNVFGFKLKQEQVNSADFDPEVLNNPDPFENFSAGVQIQQPLFNPDQLFRRRAVKNQLQAAREQLQGTRSYARYQVKDTYYQLLLVKDRVAAVEAALQAAIENKSLAQDLFDQGMITKADYLAANVRVLDLESKLTGAEGQLETVQENLRFLLGIEDEVKIQPTDSLQYQPVSLNGIGRVLRVNNSTVEALQYRLEAADAMVKSAKFSFFPRLNAFGSYEYNDDVFFGTQGENYMIGASLRWDLFSGLSKAGKITQARAERKKAEVAYQSQVAKNKMKISQARRSVEQAKKQINYAEATVEQAAEDLRIRTDRYDQGMEKTADLLRSESQLLQAKLQRLNALYEYNRSLAMLELLWEQEITQ